MGDASSHRRLLCDVYMTRRLLTAIAAALVVYGGVLYGLTQADGDIEADW